MEPSLSEESGYWDRKKAGEIIEIELNQKDGRQIAPSRSPLNDLSVYGEIGDLTAFSDVFVKPDAHLQRFFLVSLPAASLTIAPVKSPRYTSPVFCQVIRKSSRSSYLARSHTLGCRWTSHFIHPSILAGAVYA
jgi:hypothetical protein